MRLQAKRPVIVGDRFLGGPAVITCVPLTAMDRPALILQAARLGALGPDCIEWRADFLPDLGPDEVPLLLAEVAAAALRPLIVTNRRHEEGGGRPQDETLRLAILEAAASTGRPALVDVEMATAPAQARQVAATCRRAGVGVIRSWHDFEGTPPAEALLTTLRAMQASGADVAKVATVAVTPEEVLTLLGAGLEARRSFLEIPCILMAMGVEGAISRLAGGYFGSDLTFAVGIHASAPGQMELDLVQQALTALGLRPAIENRTGGVQ